MSGGFKRRKIPRELLLDPPPRKPRWWLWLPMTFAVVTAVVYAAY